METKLPRTFVDEKFHQSNHEPLLPEYLTDPPKVINIDLGRQLFVDDYLIQESSELNRVYHQAVDLQNEPLLQMESYESRSNSPLPDAVVFSYSGSRRIS